MKMWENKKTQNRKCGKIVWEDEKKRDEGNDEQDRIE